MKTTAGELALHPVALMALVALVVNDTLLKSAWPGFVTGKLSDFAGLVLLPLGLVSMTEILRRMRGRPLLWRYDALTFVALCAFGFVFVKVTPVGNDAYAWAVGAIRWPLLAVAHGDSFLEVRPILVSRDRGDLLALAVLVLPFLLIRNRRRAATTALAAPHVDHVGSRGLVQRRW